MIEYVKDASPFYLANKSYCEGLVAGLESMHAKPSGFCNSYGYEITASIEQDGFVYNFHFEKHQSTQNGIIVPVDAQNYSGVTIKVDGLPARYKASYGRSEFLRMLMRSELKNKLPRPYFAVLNKHSRGLGDEILKHLYKSKVSWFSLKNGRLLLKMHTQIRDVVELLQIIRQSAAIFAD